MAAGAIVVAALTPPGMAVVDRFRDAVGREPSQPALVKLPAPGRLLVLSPEGPWVVQEDGSKRLLGDYEDASWSPRGLFVIATRGRQLVALDSESGEPRWSLSRTEPVRDPRWSGGGLDTRIAYRAGDTLHIVAGDGSPDAVVADGVAPIAPAWKPDSHVLAYADAAGRVHVVDADTRRQLWRTRTVKGVRELAFSGNRLAVSTSTRVVVFRRGEPTPFLRPAARSRPPRHSHHRIRRRPVRGLRPAKRLHHALPFRLHDRGRVPAHARHADVRGPRPHFEPRHLS